ncbi:GNAT family N-acetyltransferase [Bremerella cremea]|uniref:GNAT family N-acetyltransferase n=1 Tax=Bremerella cremea TaxID=1031537 RepID=UPI0031F05620
MDAEHTNHLEVGLALPEHYGAALWMATGGRTRLASRGRVTALLAAEKQGKIHFNGLYTAKRGKRIVASLWCLNQPGRIATIWGPGRLPSESECTVDTLLREAIEKATEQGCHLIQSLVGADNPGAGELLSRGGFRPITILDTLQAYSDEFYAEAPSQELQWTVCEDRRDPSYVDLVAQTYVDSLDCPELDGLREIEDVLDGYFATSGQSTEYWFQLHHRGVPAGVLILAHHQDANQLELIYFGLVPAVRGRKLGGEVLRLVIDIARQLDCQSVVTGADQRNLPALSLYRRFGFHQVDSKQLYLLSLRRGNMAVA